MAQAEKKEAHIRKMATLAQAEKVALLEESLKDRKREEKNKYSDSDEETTEKKVVGHKRSNTERQDEEAARKERDAIRAQRRREIVREDRMQRAGIKKTKNERDGDRDISEKIALG